MRPENGSSIPVTPTVSMWAFSISDLPPPDPRAVAITFGRPGAASSISTSRPARSAQPRDETGDLGLA